MKKMKVKNFILILFILILTTLSIHCYKEEHIDGIGELTVAEFFVYPVFRFMVLRQKYFEEYPITNTINPNDPRTSKLMQYYAKRMQSGDMLFENLNTFIALMTS